MGDFGSVKKIKILMVVSVIVLVIGLPTIFVLLQSPAEPRIETQPHPLAQIPPSITGPTSDIGFIDIDDLRILIDFSMFTYVNHNHDRGTSVNLDILVKNNGTTTIDNLHFWRMTIYWVDGSANFTTGFTTSNNYTLDADEVQSIELDDANSWTGIPESLCWGGGDVYGRILMSYDSENTYILTTLRTSVMHMVE